MKKVLVLIFQSEGNSEPTVFADTPDGRYKMDQYFRMSVTENIGERQFDGEVRDLNDEEISVEIEEAIKRDYAWSGWDCSIFLVECEVEQ